MIIDPYFASSLRNSSLRNFETPSESEVNHQVLRIRARKYVHTCLVSMLPRSGMHRTPLDFGLYGGRAWAPRLPAVQRRYARPASSHEDLADYYEVLQVNSDASSETIKASYRSVLFTLESREYLWTTICCVVCESLTYGAFHALIYPSHFAASNFCCGCRKQAVAKGFPPG
jgi:hypothetical protein